MSFLAHRNIYFELFFFSRITDWPNPDWCLHTYLWKFRYIIMSPLHLDLFYQIANATRVLPGLELCYLQVDIKQVDERGLRMWFEPVTSKAKHNTCGLKWLMQMEFHNTRYSKYNNYFKKFQIVKFDHNKKIYERWKLLKHQGGLN